jgi:hypothetical protein
LETASVRDGVPRCEEKKQSVASNLRRDRQQPDETQGSMYLTSTRLRPKVSEILATPWQWLLEARSGAIVTRGENVQDTAV